MQNKLIRFVVRVEKKLLEQQTSVAPPERKARSPTSSFLPLMPSVSSSRGRARIPYEPEIPVGDNNEENESEDGTESGVEGEDSGTDSSENGSGHSNLPLGDTKEAATIMSVSKAASSKGKNISTVLNFGVDTIGFYAISDGKSMDQDGDYVIAGPNLESVATINLDEQIPEGKFCCLFYF